MREIKNVTKEIEDRAYSNVKGFDLTKLCFKTIFELLDNSGVFYKAVNDILKTTKPNNVKINLETFKYGVVKENDGEVYPKVDLIITVVDSEVLRFLFTVTPFNAKMELDENIDLPLGCVDYKLTKAWHIIMKGFYYIHLF